MKILAVNPWVYDFTYYDLYAKPYGLLMLCSVLEGEGHHVDFIDFCYAENYDEKFSVKRKKDGTASFYKEEIEIPEAYYSIKKKYFRFGLPPKYIDNILQKLDKPDIILVTSVMTYWYLGVRDTIGLLKKHFPDIPCYLGGIYATLMPEHAKKHVGADFIIKGGAENFFKVILKKSISVDGIFPKMELFYKKLYYIPVLTSIGCPFSCDYCASNTIYNGDLSYFDTSKCFDYIKNYSELYETNIVAFYDDALLYHREAHLYKILDKIINSELRLRFYTPNGLHIRFIDERCAETLKCAGFQKLRLSLEFIEKSCYDNKTTLIEFEKAMKVLHKVGFKQDQIGVYLICGIDGQKKEDVKMAIDYVYDKGAYPYLSEYSPVPGSKIFNNDMQKCKYPLLEPLYHNNSIFPMEHKDFTYQDFIELKNYNREKRSNSYRND